MSRERFNRMELMYKAIQFITAQKRGDPRCKQLIDKMKERTGLTEKQINDGIFVLAMGGRW